MADKNKNNYLWIGIVVVAVIVIAIVFISNSNNNSQNEVTCNSPYIKIGNSCCLDSNNNGICDSDETPVQNQQPPQQETNTPPSNNYQETKVCKTIHHSGGWYGGTYVGLPNDDITVWLENACGYEINGILDEQNAEGARRYCQGDVLVDGYFTCESNQCIKQARRFNCAELKDGGKCYDGEPPRGDLTRPECYFVKDNGDWQVITTN